MRTKKVMMALLAITTLFGVVATATSLSALDYSNDASGDSNYTLSLSNSNAPTEETSFQTAVSKLAIQGNTHSSFDYTDVKALENGHCTLNDNGTIKKSDAARSLHSVFVKLGKGALTIKTGFTLGVYDTSYEVAYSASGSTVNVCGNYIQFVATGETDVINLDLNYSCAGDLSKGHNFGSLVEEVPATCIATGVAAHYECQDCHAIFDKDKDHQFDPTLPMINHSFYWVDSSYKCITCNDTMEHVHNFAVSDERINIHIEDKGKSTKYAKKQTSGEFTYIAWNNGYNSGFRVNVSSSASVVVEVYMAVNATAAGNVKPLSNSVAFTFNGSAVTVSSQPIHTVNTARHADRWTDFVYQKVANVTLVNGNNTLVFDNTKVDGFNIDDVALICEGAALQLEYDCHVDNTHSSFEDELDITNVKTNYNQGETFTLAGSTVSKVCETCGDLVNVSHNLLTISNTQPLTTSDTSVTVSYVEGEKTYNVDVDINVAHVHQTTFVAGTAATCAANQTIDHYDCTECLRHFSDQAATTELETIEVPGTKLSHASIVAATKENSCCKDYYTCSDCNKVFLDASGTYETSLEFAKESVKHNHTSVTHSNNQAYICDACHETVYEFRFDDERVKKNANVDKSEFALGTAYDTLRYGKVDVIASENCTAKLSFELSAVRYNEIINDPDGITDFVIKINNVQQNLAGSLVSGTGSNAFKNYSYTYFGEFNFIKGINTIEFDCTIHKPIEESGQKLGNAYNIRKMIIESEASFEYDICPICHLTHNELVSSHCTCGDVSEILVTSATVSKSLTNKVGLKYLEKSSSANTATFTVNSDVNKTVALYLSVSSDKTTALTLGSSFAVSVNDGESIASETKKHIGTQASTRGRTNSSSKNDYTAHDFAYVLVGNIDLVSGSNTIVVTSLASAANNLYKIALVG